MDLFIIAALARNGGIGVRGGLLCHLPADLRHFKKVTTGHTVVMGRKTWESLPSGALLNRRNIVLSRTTDVVFEGAECYGSLDEALLACEGDAGGVFIIGGGAVYEAAMPLARRLYLTSIECSGEGADVFFPSFNPVEWETIELECHEADERNCFAYTFLTLQRR